jgi:hypothetical protein
MIQRLLFLLLLSICCLCSRAQILIDNTTYNPTQLVTNILLGNGVTASNISFTPAAGANIQLGYFNGVNSNLGLDSGIVLATGDVMEIEPGFVGGLMPPGGSDPDLLTVANSVPPLIGQAFVVGARMQRFLSLISYLPQIPLDSNIFSLQMNIKPSSTRPSTMFLLFLSVDRESQALLPVLRDFPEVLQISR